MSKKQRAGKVSEERVSKGKLVRDGFTMPKADHGLIEVLKERALQARRATKKSEVLRAGLHALAAMTPPKLVALLAKLEPIKTGRPRKVRGRPTPPAGVEASIDETAKGVAKPASAHRKVTKKARKTSETSAQAQPKAATKTRRSASSGASPASTARTVKAVDDRKR